MTQDELNHALGRLLLRGYLVVSDVVDGEPQYHLTDKGKFAVAEAQWRAA